MFERLRFEIGWHWNKQRHNIIVYEIMFAAIIAGSILLSGNAAHNLAEAGRHRN